MKITKYLFLALAFSPLSYAVSEADLVEVNAETQTKCVEYYTKNGTLFCSTKVLDNSPALGDISKYEKQQIKFDDRSWKYAWGKKGDDIVTLEYVPMGDDINDWKELITSQYMPNIPPNVSPRSMAEIIINDLKKNGFDPVITWHKVTPDMVIFEFQIKQPANMVQDEIQMIRRKSDGVYLLHYVVKQDNMGKDTRDKWITNFESSK